VPAFFRNVMTYRRITSALSRPALAEGSLA
jgi:hypothetical protein